MKRRDRQYLSYILRHKLYVFLAGLHLKVGLWQLLLHDLSKFHPREWLPYAEMFYGDWQQEGGASDFEEAVERAEGGRLRKRNFREAWLHHQNRNPHHWQYWLLILDRPDEQWMDRGTDHDQYRRVRLVKNEPHTHGYEAQAVLRTTGEDDKHGAGCLIGAAQWGERILPLEIPPRYVREMVADWAGAGRAITGEWDLREWYEQNKERIILNEETRWHVERLVYGFDYEDPKWLQPLRSLKAMLSFDRFSISVGS